MTVRVDPRRLGLLKQLAAEAGVRPGELVQLWVEQRLDAERGGLAPAGAPIMPTAPTAEATSAITTLAARLDDLFRRIATLEASQVAALAPPPAASPASAPSAAAPASADAAPRKRGRPRKTETAVPSAPTRARRGTARGGARRAAAQRRVALHDEIIAVIRERGPLTAAELAAAVNERGRYYAPRSAHPLDAAIVNSRVSNPVYRSRFKRNEGRIGLAEE
ncbi:MAG: hypothetical protein M3O93_00345 [Chloroflexota bacterium]|nr:hypothetical protein [Chloroflexota bacterium]